MVALASASAATEGDGGVRRNENGEGGPNGNGVPTERGPRGCQILLGGIIRSGEIVTYDPFAPVSLMWYSVVCTGVLHGVRKFAKSF